MSAPEGYFSVYHGKLTLNIPKRVFRGSRAEVVPEERDRFRELTRSRYPWINDRSFEVMMENARKEFLRLRDEESGGLSAVKRLEEDGDYKGAEKRLRSLLDEDPENPDLWTELGKVLCELGRKEEGYQAFNEARKYYRRPRTGR